jgi:hypothetical protein
MKERDDTEDIGIEGRTILKWMLENRDINQNICHDFILFNIKQFQVPLLKVKGNHSSKHRFPNMSQVAQLQYISKHIHNDLFT